MIIDHSKDTFFFDSQNPMPLPFSVKQFRIKNYNGIVETGISGIPLDSQWIFLTGENGFGKTSILQALTIGLFGDRDGNRLLLDDQKYCKVAVEIYAEGKNVIKNYFDSPFKPFTNFAAYGPSRLDIQSPETQNNIAGKSSQTYSIFNTDGILLNIEFELVMLYISGKKAEFITVKQTLLELLPYIKDIVVDKEMHKVFYIEKETGENGRSYKPLPFNKLASGHKSIIALVGDILIRLKKQQPKVFNPNDLSGIVLIDELELHLHPKYQRVLPTFLSTVFPKIQFIVSTNSVIPFLGSPEKSVICKVTRNMEYGVQLKRLELDIKNLLPNAILTSPLFDLESGFIPASNKKFSKIRTEDTYRKIIENDEKRRRLEEFEDSDLDYPYDLLVK